MRALLVVVTLVSALVHPSALRAQPIAPPTARLSVVRAEGADLCADERAVAREVQARLGRDAIDRSAERSIEVLIQRDSARWRAVLTLRESSSTEPARRELTSSDASCAELDASIVLAVALVIDPNGADAIHPENSSSNASAARQPPAAVTQPQRNLAQPTASRPAASVTPAPIDAWNRSEVFSFSAGFTFGSTPIAPVFALAFEGSRRGLLRPFVGAARTLEARLVDEGRRAQTFGFSRTHAFAGICLGIANARLSGDLCPTLDVGIVTSVLFDTRVLEPARPGDYPWIAAAVSVRGGVRLWGPLALELGAAPMLSLLRQRFAIEGVSVAVFEQSIVGVDVWASMRARFW